MSKSVPVPFSEPPWLNGLPSPYYNDSHRRWQKACRAFIQEHLLENCFDWDEQGLVPEHVFKEFAEHNMLIPSLPAPLPVDWLKKLGVRELLGGVKVEEFDYIHTAIYTDEVKLIFVCQFPGPGV
jgi:acyl-CoA dehydrogenase